MEILTPQQLHQFDNLELLAKQVVEGFIIGLHKSPFHGFSVEFAEHRLYNSGEAVRNIDWRVFARTDKLFVKRFEEETNLRCRIILDASSSMYFPEDAGEKGKPGMNKLRFSIVSAAALMYILRKQRDAVGLTIFSNEVEWHSRAKSTTVHQNLLFSQLEQLLQQQQRNKVTAAARCLHQIAENIHQRSMVVIFSDMFENADDADEIFSALQHLKYNKHEVILFHVADKKRELDFEFENRPYEFVDMETGEKVKLQPNQVKEFYRTQLDKFMKQLQLRCHQYRIDLVEADINKDFTQVLLPYFTKRSKMM
ncbi:DUF58 domain-containing protein [Sphingobacteriales bacterium UPWRP_1]|nr:DUF58 domain-containing protein [Sphingobacteriales bacterium TSM_CSS]PSJ74761.1 DUF58 domain-containing protein [Sphingobacteriales bacterium UPWRP_1]